MLASRLALAAVVVASVGSCAGLHRRHGGGLVVLRGVRVIDGQGGPPLEDQNVVLDGARVRAVGPRASLVVPASARIVDLPGKTVYPGLISDHSHVGTTEGLESGAGHYTRANVLRQLGQFAHYGVTTITSLGFNPTLFYDLQREVRTEDLPVADLYGADRGIGVPGGAPPVAVGDDQLYRPATPDEARAAVREMAERKPTLLKLWVDDFAGTLPGKMPPAVYQAVIDEAHGLGLRVAAHVFYLEDARQLVASGVDVLAHGVRDREVDDALIEEMKRRHTWYIPTLGLDETFYLFAEAPAWTQEPFFRHALQPVLAAQLDDAGWRERTLLDRGQVDRWKKASTINQRNTKRLFDAGVLVGFGTDSGATSLRIPGFAEHRELELLVAAGLSPLQALHLATHEAAALLGLSDRGSIVPGQLADLVVVDGRPDERITDTRRIVAVWKRGQELPGGVERFEP